MRAAPQTACMLKSCTAGKGLKTGEVECLLGLCSAISDYRLLFQLKFWVGRGAYNHSALWVIFGLLVKHFMVLIALSMKEIGIGVGLVRHLMCSIVCYE